MKRKVFRRIFIFSLVGFVLLGLFTVGLWAFANAGAALFRIVFLLDEDLEVHGIPFSAFMANFIGSPLFHIYLVDIAAMLTGIIGLTVTKKERKHNGPTEAQTQLPADF